MTVSHVTLSTLRALRDRGEKAVWVTAYDYPTAVFADRAGIDVILVGDSAAMTMLGLPNTLGIGMREMLLFIRAVVRGVTRAWVIGDLPFLSYQVSDAEAVRNAGRMIAAGCHAVKCEGGVEVASRVQAMTDAGIAVVGHLGLTPQRVGLLGGYRVQGKNLDAARRLRRDAQALEAAGAVALLLEAMPAAAAAFVRGGVRLPVYGIGAGPGLDGQLLIGHDLLGCFVGDIAPRFARKYADLGGEMIRAYTRYAEEVRAGSFPGPGECYPIDPEVARALRELDAIAEVSR